MKPSKKAAFALLTELAFVRTAGSKEELKAARILQKEAKSAGVQVVIEPFTITDAKVQRAELEILEPYQKKYTITAYKCCGNTAAEGLTAELVYAANVTDVDLANIRGKIVLINGFLRLPVYKKLCLAGAAALITMTGSLLDKEDETDLFTRKLRLQMQQFGLLPAANLRVSDGFGIVSKKAAKARLTILGENVEQTSHNVIATVPGTKNPEEIISFGAHYDSTEFSTGVYDNGAGSVILMEMLKYFAANPPARTVKLLWFGSEEIGLEGSKAFTRDHADELKSHIFMINVDVGGPVLGFNVCKVTGSKELTAFTDGFMKVKGFPVETSQGIYSSDSIPFADNGIPAVNFSRDAAPGAAFIHSRNDVMDYLSADGLGALMDPVFAYAKALINAVAFPEKREIPTEMQEEVDQYLFKKEQTHQ